MSNLIITIISIALVAVAALMAAWYGSSAFQNAGGKAGANGAINQAKQIAGGASVYAVTHGGSFDGITVADLASGDDQYLQGVPTPPTQVTASNQWTLMNLSDSTNTTSGLNGVELDLDTTAISSQICNTVA